MRHDPLVALSVVVMFAVLPTGGCASVGQVVSPNAGPAIVDAALAALADRGGREPWPSWKLSLYGGPDGRTYLGCLWCDGDPDSVLDPHGRFGRTSAKSILNRSSVFGHPDSNYSPCNRRATAPPVVISGTGASLGRLTVNTDLPDAVQVESIKRWIAGACAGRSGAEGTEDGPAGHGAGVSRSRPSPAAARTEEIRQ